MNRQDYVPSCSTTRAFCAVVSLTALFAINAPLAHAAVAEAWFQSYNSGPGISLDRSVGVAVDHLGNVVVTGQIDDVDRITSFQADYYTAKYSAADGSLLWQQRFNRSVDSYDYPTAVAVDRHGNVVVTGHSSNPYTAKYAAEDGALLWEQFVWNGSVQIEAMALDHKGNVAVVGNFYVARYGATDGRLLWEQHFNGSATAVAVDVRGNVVVTGERVSESFNSDYCTAKYSAKDGALIWERTYDGPGGGYDYPVAVAVDDSGNVVVTGSSDKADPTTNLKPNYYTAKYAASNGALIWEQRYNGPDNSGDYARAIAMDRRGNVVVTGDSYFLGSPHAHSYTVKYAAEDGAVLWGSYYTGRENTGGDVAALALDHRGNVVITGVSYDGWVPGFYTAKYAALDGSLRWEKFFTGPGTWKYLRLSSHSLALGPDGMVAISGSSAFEYNLNLDFATLVYRRGKSPPKPAQKKALKEKFSR